MCCEAIHKHAEQPGVSPCMKDFVMHRRLLLAIGASTANPVGFQGTPMKIVNASRSETTAQIRSPQLFRRFPHHSRPSQEDACGPLRLQPRHVSTHNLEVHCLTDRCHRAVTFLSSQPGTSAATVVSLDESTEHIRRVSHEPWQHDALSTLLPSFF